MSPLESRVFPQSMLTYHRITSSGSWWSANFSWRHTQKTERRIAQMWHLSSNCSFFDSFKMTSRFGNNWFRVVGEIFDSVRILFQSPRLKFGGYKVVGWEGAISRYLDLNWMKPWMVKKMPLQGGELHGSYKNRGLFGSFSRYGFSDGFLQAVGSK